MGRDLGLWSADANRGQPRGANGQFVKVRYTPHRLKVLAVARDMRERLGLPPSEWLEPYRTKDGDNG